MRLGSIGLLWLLVVGSAGAAEWQPITTDLLAKEKPGFGGLSGVLVDHTTGRLYVSVSDRGVFQSDNQGLSWQRVGEAFKGRTEWPGCMVIEGWNRPFTENGNAPPPGLPPPNRLGLTPS